MRVYLPQIGEVVDFTQAKDGWWECRQWSRAIDPDMSVCIMDPYCDSMGGDPPKFDFEVVDYV